MSRFMTKKDAIATLRDERVKEAVLNVAEESRKAIEAVNRRPTTPQDASLSKSFAKRRVEGINPADIRRRMPVSPKGQRWGGSVVTDRDLEHCLCGCLIADHTPEKHPNWCACKRTYDEKKATSNQPIDPNRFTQRGSLVRNSKVR